ncbi:MAG TPA: Calx-beta domain-containing protein, partial [Pirellulales bacterium]
SVAGNGTVTVQGTGGNTSGGVDIGVFVSDVASRIFSVGGSITVVGQGGGSGASANNHGVYVQIGGQISAGGNGAVNVQGIGGSTTGGNDVGVFITGADSQITSGGAVAITGHNGPNSNGIQLAMHATVSTSNNANLTLIANQIDFDTSNVLVSAGTGTVNFKPFSADLSINLGGADSATQLGLTGAELNCVMASAIIIGDTSTFTGPITVSNPISVAPALSFQWLVSATTTLVVNAPLSSSASISTIHLDNATLNADISSISLSGDATAITVDDSPSGQIKDAIDLAGPTATIQVLAGTYVENVDASAKAITLAPGIGPAQVIINGNLKLGSSDTLVLEIAGPSAASQYDNLVVHGTVALGGANVSVTLGTFTPAASDTFTIIDNDATDAVSGTFKNLVEGQVFAVNSIPFQITYQGSDGNNVVLLPVTLVQVAVSPASVAEDGSAVLVYTFTRSGTSTTDLTVNFSVGGAANFGTDYVQTGAATFTATTGTVTIPAGSASATVTIDPTSDSTVEPDETVALALTNGNGYFFNTSSTASGKIVNDDTAVFTINDVTVDESAGTMQFTVSLSNPIDTVAKVNVNFTDVTTGAADFNHAPQ